ncbi:hypothetical protein FB451DRAFT_1182251 [Mycena latifolia]|nr:hypothetical protein FB451DRAFT_1182251 [Mycena latifolia]
MSHTVTTADNDDAGPSNNSSIFSRHTVLVTSTPAPASANTPVGRRSTSTQSPARSEPHYEDERSAWIKSQDDEPTFIIKEDQKLSFPPLTLLSDQIPDMKISSWSIEDIVFHVPTVMPEFRTSNNLDVQERRTLAIVQGARKIRKSFLLSAKSAPHRLHDKVFKRELETLEEVLTHVVKGTTESPDDMDVYRVRADNYYALSVQAVPDEDETVNVTAIKVGAPQNKSTSIEKGKQPAFERDLPPHMDNLNLRSTSQQPPPQGTGKGREQTGDYDAIRRSQSAMYHNPDASIRMSATIPGGTIPKSSRRLSELFTPMDTLFEHEQNADQSQGHAFQPAEYEQYRQDSS